MCADHALPVLAEVLERYWGYRELRPHQGAAMATILESRDSVVVLPTGGGKSLCYQAPALTGEGLAVVVSPLIALMKDQVDALTANGIPAALFNSSLSAEQRRKVLSGLRRGDYRLLYLSPERLVGHGREAFRRLLAECDVRYFAVDEAHCVSHWGHDFRPEYRQLGMLKEAFKNVSMHAFTATATAQVRADIAAQLHLQDPQIIVGSFARSNLVYRVLRRDNLRAQVRKIIGRHRDEGGIIYCISRREVDRLTEHLQGQNLRALAYHAGLDSSTRRRHQEEFINERADIMVATVAFGMGIDRSNIRYVIHAGAPRSLEHYQQEAGRAGRDGLEAECVLIYSFADFATWQRILEESDEFTASARHQLRDICSYACQVTCRHRALVEYFGQSLAEKTCAACDVCLGELEAIAAPVILAQKILSCVVRVRQRWGTGQVIDVLRGRDTERVRSAKHDQLSTFSILSDTPVAELRGYIEQLIEKELLLRTSGDYPLLEVTQEGWRLLRDEITVELYRQIRPSRRKREARPQQADIGSWEGVDRDLFDQLRKVRLAIAQQRGVPPYVIFHDSMLRDMARKRPSNLASFREVYGVGERKAFALRELFLAAISGYCLANRLDQDLS